MAISIVEYKAPTETTPEHVNTGWWLESDKYAVVHVSRKKNDELWYVLFSVLSSVPAALSESEFLIRCDADDYSKWLPLGNATVNIQLGIQ